MILIVLLLLPLAMLISVPLTAWLISLGRKWGHLDEPGGDGSHKRHARPVPVTGGIGIFATVMLPLAAALLAIHFVPVDSLPAFLAPMRDHAAGLRSQTAMGLAVVAAAAIFHVMGLIDDRRRLGPFSKLIVQIIVAATLAGAFDMRVLQLLDQHGPLGKAASIAISVLWIVTITNAINFLDNMDGLSAGVSAIIAAIYLAATLIGGQWFVAAMCALLLGALIGFLIFNFPPARVFMGDAGALVVGLLLAVISIRTTYIAPGAGALGSGAAGMGALSPHALGPHAAGETLGPGSAWYGVLMPLVVMAIPLYDIASVTLIRLSQGKSPFHPDQQHFSHRLVARGLSRRAAVIVIWLCTLATGLGGVLLGRLEAWQAALVATQSIAVVVMLAVMERSAGRANGE